MAMTLDTAIKFTAKLEGQGLDQLKRGLQGLAQQSNRTSKDLDQLYNANKKLSQASGLSINGLQRQIGVMTQLRNEAVVGTRQFKFYSAELQKLQKQQAGLDLGGAKNGGLLGALGGLKGGVAGLVAGVGLTQAMGAIARDSMDAETANVRLKALTDTYGEYADAQQMVARIASTLRLNNTEATDSFSKLYAGLRPVGVGLKELEQIFVGFNAAARASGATADETANAMIQLKQSLVSGRAQGDELRSILEQAPALGQAVAEEMTKVGEFGKVTRSQLKDLGAEGKISTDVLIAALKRLGETELPKVQKTFDTGQQAVTDFQNAIKDTNVELGKLFGPTVIAGLKLLTGALRTVADALKRNNNEQAMFERAQLQASKDVMKKFPGLEGATALTPRSSAFYNQRLNQLMEEQRIQAAKGDRLDAGQIAARQQADKEREAARAAARKAALEDELKIREDTEKKLADEAEQYQQRLADLRVETIKRAADLERSLGDQRLQIERDIAASRRRTSELEQDAALEAEKRRLSAAGLSTEGIDAAQQVNEIFRRYSEQKIQNEQAAVDRQTQLQRELEQFKTSVADSIGKLQEGYARSVSNILQDAGDKLAAKMVNGAQSAAGVLGGTGGGGGALGPSSLRAGTVGGGRLQIGTLVGLAKAAGFNDRDARIMAAIAMAESRGGSGELNNNPGTGDLSYGLWQINMLGRMGPERRRALGISNNAQLFDPATNAMAARQIYQSQGFGAWSVFRSGAYRQYLPGAMAAAPGGVPSAAPGGFNSAGLMGVVQRAGQRLGAANSALAGQQNQQARAQFLADAQSTLTNFTSELDSQSNSVRQQLEDQQKIYKLMRSGLSPEVAKQRVDAANAAESERQRLMATQQAAAQAYQEGKITKEDLAIILDTTQKRLDAQAGIVSGLQAEAQQLEALQQAYERHKQTVEAISNAVGTGLNSAFDLLISGTDNWGNSLREIASSVLKDIAKQLFQIYVVNTLISGISKLFPGPSGTIPVAAVAANGMVAANGIQPFEAGGIVNRPTLFAFANGGAGKLGLMGEAGPEAIMPLRRGRDGKLGVAGGGSSTVVNVSVDAKGTSVQGNDSRGDQLGRAVAAAVQAELVRQKRPGGILAA